MKYTSWLMKTSVPLNWSRAYSQRVDARHVQVGGGLVHEQQVGRVEQQLHQRQPALLAAAQDARPA